MRKLFGTDGVRAQANTGPMRPDHIMKIALAAGQYFKDHFPLQGEHHPTVVIGKDTRLSGYMVEAALQAGFVAQGMNVLLLGPLPTPAVALLTRSFRAQLGVMISASHNPAKDNGIKFFGPDGFKLKDQQEKVIEDLYFSDQFRLSDALHLGKAQRVDDAAGRYLEFVKGTFPRDYRLDGLKIVVDSAHGAAYKLAPRLYWELGADVISLNAEPNGLNINFQCGATHTDALCQAVLDHKADIGFALDGDADRLIAVDEKGHIIDGDQILAAVALALHKEKRLKNGTIVATQMSNLGMERCLNGHGIHMLRTQVGDRYVLEAMRQGGYNLGGEQSGHIILGDFSSTGDGIMASLQLLKIMIDNPCKSSALGETFSPTPQKLVNVQKCPTILNNKNVEDVLAQTQDHLGALGRVFVRPSGTEPLIRVMIEAESTDAINVALSKILKAMNDVA
ncbi:MAG: Phosphoglucosamine mutase [Holosporales bacterium]